MSSKNVSKHNNFSYMVLAISIILCGLLRIHSFSEPVEADEALYAVIAKNWIDGGKPYITLWDNKPIGTFIAYRAAIQLFGYNELAPKIFAFISTILSTVFLYVILRSTSKWTLAISMIGVWPAASCLVSCYANGSNIEILLNTFLLLSYCFLRQYVTGGQYRYWILAVITLIGSMLIKQVTLPFLLLPFIVLQKHQLFRLKPLCYHLLVCLAVGVAMHIATYRICGYSVDIFAHQFRENSQYVSLANNGSIGTFLWALIRSPMGVPILPLTPVLIAGVVLSISPTLIYRDRHARLFFGYFLLTALSVSLPGGTLPHYYILYLPVTVISFSFLLESVQIRSLFRYLIAGVFCSQLAYITWSSYLSKHPNMLSYEKYDSNWFVLDRFIGTELRARGITGKRIFVDGSHPGIYFYSQNTPATTHIAAWAYVSMGITTWDAIFEQLKRSPPEVCVLTNPAVGAFRDWVFAHYDWLDTIGGSHVLLRSKKVSD